MKNIFRFEIYTTSFFKKIIFFTLVFCSFFSLTAEEEALGDDSNYLETETIDYLQSEDYDVFSAIKSGDKEKIAALTYKIINIPLDEDTKQTILMKSLEIGASREGIAALIESGADVNAKDNDGKTALVYALLNACGDDIVRLLIENMDDIDTPDNLGRTALAYAIANRSDIGILKLLLKNGANINSRDNYDDTILIDYVIAQGADEDTSVLDFLIKNGIDLDARNPDGVSQFIEVLQNTKNVKVISAIINAKANTTSRDNICGWDALMYACVLNQKSEVVRQLLNSGCDANRTDKYGNTPLMLGVSNNLNIDAVTLLIGHTNDINHKDSISGKTALILSIENNADEKVISALISNNADVNASLLNGIYRGMTALMFAAKQNSNLNVVKMLVQNNAVLNAKNSFGKTVYRFAFENPNPEIAQYIWQEINGKD